MAEAAKSKGLRWFGSSEHFDYDYPPAGVMYEDGSPAHIDEAAYFSAARSLQKQVNSYSFTYFAGGEFGYSHESSAQERYFKLIDKFSPDFIINSVHTCDGCECAYAAYFAGKDKERAYARYLERVLESLSAPYRYDIIGHVGYVSRYAPFADAKLHYDNFRELYDAILRGIISRGKILEVNSSVGRAGGLTLPDEDVLYRYFELGGRKISFGSDAHCSRDVARSADKVCAALRKIGYSCLTVPAEGGVSAAL